LPADRIPVVEPGWLNEAERRLQRDRSGETSLIDADKVYRQLEQRLP
jgi:hypothetical protein